MVKKFILILIFIGFVFLHNVTAQKIITDQYDDSLGIVFRVEAQPDFNKESTRGLLKFIEENVREVNVPEGDSRVVVQFLVDTLGCTSDHKIIKGINPELDNEALRVSRLLKFMSPAIQRGKPVNYIYTLVFDFKKYSFNKKKARENNPIKR